MLIEWNVRCFWRTPFHNRGKLLLFISNWLFCAYFLLSCCNSVALSYLHPLCFYLVSIRVFEMIYQFLWQAGVRTVPHRTKIHLESIWAVAFTITNISVWSEIELFHKKWRSKLKMQYQLHTSTQYKRIIVIQKVLAEWMASICPITYAQLRLWEISLSLCLEHIFSVAAPLTLTNLSLQEEPAECVWYKGHLV